ncbi:hypothetical protein MKW98_013160 [Papaver atlanticum]|uniref:RING-type domain-containing protein n=1 Tax=Papaver atlanticum TaxID=357466 RepID=A0AAD4T8L4_9MAGN|nr:hypothetical protein MKW98_013160 [Papaver atlanticum]
MAELSNHRRPKVTYSLNLKLIQFLSSDLREYDNNSASENSKLGVIEILLKEKTETIFRYPLDDDDGLPRFGIDEYPRIDYRVHVNNVENLYWFHNAINYVTHMLNQLNIHNHMECFRDVQNKVTAFVVETAKAAARNPQGVKSFKVVADLNVNIDQGTLVSERYNGVDNVDYEMSNADSYDSDVVSSEDLDDQSSDIIDEYGMSETDDELDLAVEQSIEDMKVRASESAIVRLERRTYLYEDGDDSLGENRTGSAADCVVCMDSFEVGAMIAYMPCSHFFHENCLVQWLQESNSWPLRRFEISSSDK